MPSTLADLDRPPYRYLVTDQSWGRGHRLRVVADPTGWFWDVSDTSTGKTVRQGRADTAHQALIDAIGRYRTL